MTDSEALAPFRATSRLILADESDAVLLFLTYGKSHAIPPRWITPGGGVDPGEDHRQAAIRELWEETGLRVDSIGAPFAVTDFDVNTAWHPYRHGYWEWFARRTSRFEPSSANWMPDEHDDIVAHRWWSLADLEAAAPPVEPDDLAGLIRQGIASFG